MKRLLSGNEAIAYGAYEAGCRFGVGYPGTPSTEILQNFVKYPGVYGEWAPNEKVALDVAVGMSYAVERVFVTMKHVGLNVASDSLFSAVHTGVRGGLVVVSADDPGHHSSQNEQDNRQYGKFAKLPVMEPADSAEAAAFVATAMEISERFDTPVLFRSTTRLSHSRTVLDYPETLEAKGGPHERVKYLREPSKQIPLPENARRMHREIEQRLIDIAAWAETCELNRIEPGDSRLGIVASGMAYQYAREVFPEATFLKIGLAYPLPRQLFFTFAGMVDQVVVIEELDPFYEEHIRLLGIDVVGKDVFPLCGEFSVEVVRQSAIEGGLLVAEAPATATEIVDIPLPPRPPMLCPGCSHRGVFYVLQRLRAVVFGDIGCYTLGALPPLNATHTCGPMGASVGMAHGVDKVGVKDRTVAVLGDSTFFHSGMSPLVNIVTNGGISTTIVVDNSVTAMTGHQTNPGTGRTLMGEESPAILIENVAKALGYQKVDVIDPYDLQNTRKVLTDHLDSQTPSVVVVRAPCILHTRERHPAPVVDPDVCDACGTCLHIGCAPIVNRGDCVEIEALLCVGCDYCVEVCPKGAIVSRRATEEGGA
jgi:indolepyruvate ferredoxin oxidoreductase, alpha subunit